MIKISRIDAALCLGRDNTGPFQNRFSPSWQVLNAVSLALFRCTTATALAKEAPEQVCGFNRKNAAQESWPPMKGGLFKQFWSVNDGPTFGVIGSPDQPPDTSMTNGSSAHGTRL
jgi:hypothetical protein